MIPTVSTRYRVYGAKPYGVVLVHGGPGGAGSVASVARTLSNQWSVLEPFQTKTSVDSQVEELRQTIEEAGAPPVTLIGHSWGAWLAYLVAARHPGLVRKLVLVGSGGFEAKHAEGPERVRLSRLTPEQREEATCLREGLASASGEQKKRMFARFGELFSLADALEPIPHEREPIEYRPDIFLSVWPEAAALRASGELLALGRRIRCPVVAVHGDYDSHPAEGVRDPLSTVVRDFRFVLLGRCGHEPWVEKHARDEFYRVLRAEIDPSLPR
jgi:pimeloyl-ACP methyl ester carboxylesterase